MFKYVYVIHVVDKRTVVLSKAFILDCNFEAEHCSWLVDSETSYNWTISIGSTSTEDTGPDYDHTIGTDEGHYIYIKDSGFNIPKDARSKLISTTINPGSDICLTFWYHMNGENIGILNVYTESGNIIQQHWSQSGNKESKWTFAEYTISKSGPYRIIFEGVRGDGFSSYIALDDISLLESSCSGLLKTSQTCQKTDESISLHECSKYYLQHNETSLVFDRELDNCSAVYQDVQTSIKTLFAETSTVSSANTSTKDSSAGLVVGLVIGGLFLVCVVTLIVVLIRRHTFKSKPREKIRNNLGGNDYIGSQDIALPLTANLSSHMLNDGKNSNTAYVVRQNTTLSDNQILNDDKYSIVDQTAETSLNGTRDDETGTADNYMVLDPSATGFNRTKLSKTPTGYAFAKPVGDTGKKTCDEDQYALSEEGVYDHSGSNRHKESEDNIYNHAVDTIYDSGSHKKNDEGREDTYDHFFGQKTEDDYDISTTT
ncbi:unnamed protein product [Mytilus coruscus]|uniref:MAM domain-containing protein n=1 Tax=Mytilus coruscus TaxID=42192 RepID=A0A6J7ZVE4_MYTCO|nr:unnamed protein product [Mytilus coruscus]